MTDRISRYARIASFTLLASAVSWVLGYAAGKLVSGAGDAPLWLQAATSLCVLVLAAVVVWATLRRTSGQQVQAIRLP